MGRRPAASRACVCAGIALPGALLIQSVEPASRGSQSRDLAQAWPHPAGGRVGLEDRPQEELSSHTFRLGGGGQGTEVVPCFSGPQLVGVCHLYKDDECTMRRAPAHGVRV